MTLSALVSQPLWVCRCAAYGAVVTHPYGECHKYMNITCAAKGLFLYPQCGSWSTAVWNGITWFDDMMRTVETCSHSNRPLKVTTPTSRIEATLVCSYRKEGSKAKPIKGITICELSLECHETSGGYWAWSWLETKPTRHPRVASVPGAPAPGCSSLHIFCNTAHKMVSG